MKLEKNSNTPVRYDKEGTKNPIAKAIYNNYKLSLSRLIQNQEINSILEIGCGGGEILEHIHSLENLELNLVGVDIDKNIIHQAKNKYSYIDFRCEDGYNLSFSDNNFDLVLVLEVLEHVKDVQLIINEAKRVSKKYLIFSVPREPLWRILNIFRGAHIFTLGNTPGHINHWGSRQFVKLISNTFHIHTILKPLPWTMILCNIE